ncbi:helix-turn-helix transcriptional regulator [Pseudoalteromonas gelatinilytica]|nr:LuxR C-terminal-related transcriptional regulator [Pseudoalteromonas profundi]
MDFLLNKNTADSVSSASILPYCIANDERTLLLNYDSLDTLTNRELISEFMKTHGYHHLVIFNMPHRADVLPLKDWPKLKGLFFKNTKTDIFEQGLQEIKKGSLWFPRTVSDKWMREMLETEQKNQIQSNNLTFKESKVLHLLSSGATCPQIADTLFISEATVRVHLHKIYQKINVKNKQKALQWCERNINKLNKLAG